MLLLLPCEPLRILWAFLDLSGDLGVLLFLKLSGAGSLASKIFYEKDDCKMEYLARLPLPARFVDTCSPRSSILTALGHLRIEM